MANLALGLVGAALTGGSPIGFQIGSMLGNLFFGGAEDTASETFGPRLNSRTVQISSYGAMIPEIYGTIRTAGNMIWVRNNEIDETENITTSTQSAPKGFGGATHTSTHTSYSYSARMAILLCRGPITGVTRIWWNGNLVWDRRDAGTPGGTLPITIYTGLDDQDPDPAMEEALGVGEVSALRGYAYVVFQDVELANGGNTIGNWEFEVVSDGTLETPPEHIFSPDGLQSGMVRDPRTGLVWASSEPIPVGEAIIIDPYTDDIVGRTPAPTGGTGFFQMPGEFSQWVAGFQPELTSIDILTGEPIFLPARMFFSGGGLLPRTLVVIDADTHQIVATQPMVYSLFGGFVWDPALQVMLFYTGQGGGSIEVIDPWTLNVESVRPVISPPGNYVIEDVLDVVVCEAHGYIAVLYQSNTLGLFQLGDPSYSDIFIGAPPWAIAIAVSGQIAYDYTRGRVWQTVDIGSDGWGYFDLITLTFVTTIASGGGGVQYGCMYNPDMDAVIAVKDNVRTAFSAVDGSVVRVIGTPGAFLFDTKMLYLPEGGDLYAYGQTGTGTYRFYLSPLVTSQAITLREIVEDICMDGGLQINEVGATELTETVLGYLIAQKMTRRAAIEGLQGYGLFGGVESDTQITFPLRAGSSVRTLTEDDLVIDEDANLSAKPDYFSSRRIEEAELPKEVAITFINPLLHYDQSTIPARRLVTHSENLQGLEMAIAMSSDTAKQKAEILLNTAWAERTTHTFSLAYDNADLNPLDIITVQLDGDVFDMIIERTNLRPHNVIDITAKSTVSATYSNTSTASDPGSPPTDGVLVVSASLLFIADIPLLTDQSSGPGIYLFASPALESQTWNGANVYRSTDNSNWTDFTSIITPTPTGSVLDDSSAFPSNEFPIIDRVNTLRVMLSSGTLSSITEAELVEGKNAALWGREVIQYTTATLQGDGSYILSGIVRSRRGTEAFREHAWVGERFIVLNHPLSRPVTDPGERDTLMYYRVVSIGQKFINGTTIAHTNTEAGLKPYPPINIEAEWDNPSANDITFSWLERTRVGAQRLPTGTTIQSAEDIEEYEVDIIDDAGAVVRSITGLTTPAATYTAAQQTTDFGAVRDWVNIKAYQKSATVGRGFTVPAWFVGPDGDVIEEDFSSGTIGVSPTGWIDEWPGNSTFTVETDLTGVGGKVLKMLLGAASPSIEHAFSVPDSAYRHPQRNILARFKMDTSFGGAVPTGFALYLIANGERSDRSFNYARFVVRGDGTGWYLQRHTSGEVREIDSILTAYTFTLDEWYWVRAEVDGNVLRARVWKDDVGVVEPSGWEGEVRYARVISSGFVAVGAQDYFKSYYLDSIRIAYGGAYA